jgi:hypothetical protein
MRSEMTVRRPKTSPTNCPRSSSGSSLASTPLADSAIDRDTPLAGRELHLRASPPAKPWSRQRTYAEGTQQVIDHEVSRLLTEAEDTARALLSDNRDALDAVVAALLEEETISGEELTEIVNRVRGAGNRRRVGAATPS